MEGRSRLVRVVGDVADDWAIMPYLKFSEVISKICTRLQVSIGSEAVIFNFASVNVTERGNYTPKEKFKTTG